MLETLKIEGFRGLKELELDGLGRVNLIVGKNNCGKTSLLEALEILASNGRPTALVRGPRRRRELVFDPRDERRRQDLDLRHLFHGHELRPGQGFRLEGVDGDRRVVVSCEVVSARPHEIDEKGENVLDLLRLLDGDAAESADAIELGLGIRIVGPETPRGVVLPLRGGGLTEVGRAFMTAKGGPPVHFLSTEGIDLSTLGQLWDELVLTPEEAEVVEVLRILETKIERVAFTGRDSRSGSSALIKLSGSPERMPLGSLGDGVRRLLSIAVVLARATGGVLLIDEIDTGLHYSALESLWRVVTVAARRLDVQVFATSHSGDCVRALAYLNEHDPEVAGAVALFRVEAGQADAVRYSAAELAIAAQHHIEVRG